MGAAKVVRGWLRRAAPAGALGALLLAAAGAAAAPAVTVAPPGGATATGGAIQVRVVSSATCSNTPLAIDLVRAVALELGLRVEVTRQIASTREDAVRHRFFGSPTVQIDGLDLEADKRASERFVLT